MLRGAVVVKRQRRAAGQRVTLAHHADVFALVQAVQHKIAVAAGSGEVSGDVGKEADANVGRALFERVARIACRQGLQAQFDARLFFGKRLQQRRHQDRGGGIGHRQGETALVGGRVEGLWIEGAAQTVHRHAHCGPNGLCVRRGGHAGRAGNEQLVTQGVAQAPQRIAHGRLCGCQYCCGARDVALDHHDVEYAQEVQVERGKVHGDALRCNSSICLGDGGIPIRNFRRIRENPRMPPTSP